MLSYPSFTAGNRRCLSFGVLAAFSSSFGQAYFIEVLAPEVRSNFGLSHTTWGANYRAGTLASASRLPFTGRRIDRFDFRLLFGFAVAPAPG